MCHHYFIITILTVTTIINPSIAALQNNLVLGTTKTPEEGIFHKTPAKALLDTHQHPAVLYDIQNAGQVRGTSAKDKEIKCTPSSLSFSVL